MPRDSEGIVGDLAGNPYGTSLLICSATNALHLPGIPAASAGRQAFYLRVQYERYWAARGSAGESTLSKNTILRARQRPFCSSRKLAGQHALSGVRKNRYDGSTLNPTIPLQVPAISGAMSC